MYFCIVLDFDKHMGMDHQLPRQLKFGTGQGVYRLDAVLGVVTWHQELEPDIRALIKISLPSVTGNGPSAVFYFVPNTVE